MTGELIRKSTFSSRTAGRAARGKYRERQTKPRQRGKKKSGHTTPRERAVRLSWHNRKFHIKNKSRFPATRYTHETNGISQHCCVRTTHKKRKLRNVFSSTQYYLPVILEKASNALFIFSRQNTQLTSPRRRWSGAATALFSAEPPPH